RRPCREPGLDGAAARTEQHIRDAWRLIPTGAWELLEELARAPVGQWLAARLARGAVLQRRVGEAHLAHDVAADRAGLAGPAVDPHPGALGVLELPGRLAGGRGDRVGQSRAQGVVEGVDLVVGELRGEGEGGEPRHV